MINSEIVSKLSFRLIGLPQIPLLLNRIIAGTKWETASMVQPKDLLTPAEITALTVIYKTYKLKQKVQRKAVEHSFYLATGKKLGRVYYAIPIVQKLLELL